MDIQTYSCTHQWCRLFEGKRVGEQHNALCVASHVFRHPAISHKASQTPILAESDIVDCLTWDA